MDQATLQAALADPTGLLTTVLGFHVVPGEQLDAAALAGQTSLTTLEGEQLPITVDGDTVMVGEGRPRWSCPTSRPPTPPCTSSTT